MCVCNVYKGDFRGFEFEGKMEGIEISGSRLRDGDQDSSRTLLNQVCDSQFLDFIFSEALMVKGEL